MTRHSTSFVTLAVLIACVSLAAPALAGIGKISFVSSRDGNLEIYLMDQDGSAQTRLTATEGGETWPAISPDGSKIAFFSQRSGQWNLHSMDLDGTNVSQLTSNLPHDIGAGITTSVIDWHPDGSRILFNVRVAGVWQLFSVAPDGTGLTQLTFGVLDTHYARYNLDGTAIHAMRNTPFNGFSSEVWVGNPNGTGFIQLTSTP
ncbi:MAG: TolB family protein, partial [Gemmatimonadota bacterium]